MSLNSSTSEARPFANGLLQKNDCCVFPTFFEDASQGSTSKDLFLGGYKNECLGHLSESEEKGYIDFINQKQYEQCCNQVYASKQATLRRI